MAEREEVVPVKEAIEQVGAAMTRLALLHLAFSETLVEQLGEEKGKELIINSILEYGKRVGERTKEGCQELPYYGVGSMKDISMLTTNTLTLAASQGPKAKNGTSHFTKFMGAFSRRYSGDTERKT
ncbi:MAG: hypothetical protein ACE5I8_02795 [Thermodesulfobacteriota bacterium]